MAALVAVGEVKKSKIHMTGFLNAGGTLGELQTMLTQLVPFCGLKCVTAATGVYDEVVLSHKVMALKDANIVIKN